MSWKLTDECSFVLVVVEKHLQPEAETELKQESKVELEQEPNTSLELEKEPILSPKRETKMEPQEDQRSVAAEEENVVAEAEVHATEPNTNASLNLGHSSATQNANDILSDADLAKPDSRPETSRSTKSVGSAKPDKLQNPTSPEEPFVSSM